MVSDSTTALKTAVFQWAPNYDYSVFERAPNTLRDAVLDVSPLSSRLAEISGPVDF